MKWWAPLSLAATVTVGFAETACSAPGFHCDATTHPCNAGETCTPQGWCAAADTTCDSAYRYTATAGGGAANQCVSRGTTDGGTMDVAEDVSADAGLDAVPSDAPDPWAVTVTLGPPQHSVLFPTPPVDCNSNLTSPPYRVLVGVVTTPPPPSCGVGGLSIICATLTVDSRDASSPVVHIGAPEIPAPVGNCATSSGGASISCPTGQVVVGIHTGSNSAFATEVALDCAEPVVIGAATVVTTTNPSTTGLVPTNPVCMPTTTVGQDNCSATGNGIATSVAPGRSAVACAPTQFGIQCTPFNLAF